MRENMDLFTLTIVAPPLITQNKDFKPLAMNNAQMA